MFNIQLTNWKVHPLQTKYTVFFFKTELESILFENLLKKQNIWFEKNIPNKNEEYFLFGIKNNSLKKVLKINYVVKGKYRLKFIANKSMRYLLIFITTAFIIIAIIGFLKT